MSDGLGESGRRRLSRSHACSDWLRAGVARLRDGCNSLASRDARVRHGFSPCDPNVCFGIDEGWRDTPSSRIGRARQAKIHQFGLNVRSYGLCCGSTGVALVAQQCAPYPRGPHTARHSEGTRVQSRGLSWWSCLRARACGVAQFQASSPSHSSHLSFPETRDKS